MVRALCVVLVLAATCAHPAAPPEAAMPTDAEVASALEKVRQDPNLTSERTVRTLKWAKERTAPRSKPGWVRWLLELFRWMAEASRVLMWVMGALLVGVLGLYIVRLLRANRWRSKARSFTVPSHVRDLDIRPESLPPDIGGAALALWELGERRAALALLYRGLLSRLAHVHAVPIRHSSTEGECLALAATHLHADRTPYVARLVRTWQRAVYGHEDPQTPDVRALCVEFAPALDPAGAQAGA